ncbi:small GTP-binding protein [Histomonas meleagridis]|uniref:small GTP-binding protein n=1 Tax=Histomonas meleagridis TaxID=135588 RepID=UPI00355AC8F6|nr:small GTP-binding protein [Histomonas meleagridis]KAH0805638.1 small GTP-binding protein [Histomonas meleagridis]
MCDFSVMMLGSGPSGKSAITIRFVQDFFEANFDPIIEHVYRRTIKIDDKNIQFSILDIGGSDDFSALRISFRRKANAFIIVYAIDSRWSFEGVKSWYRDIKLNRGIILDPVFLCGNKCDQEDVRVVSKTEGEDLAKKLGATFFETSALNNTNITEMFTELAKEILNRKNYMTQANQAKKEKILNKEICKIF